MQDWLLESESFLFLEHIKSKKLIINVNNSIPVAISVDGTKMFSKKSTLWQSFTIPALGDLQRTWKRI